MGLLLYLSLEQSRLAAAALDLAKCPPPDAAVGQGGLRGIGEGVTTAPSQSGARNAKFGVSIGAGPFIPAGGGTLAGGTEEAEGCCIGTGIIQT